MDNFLHLGLMF